MPNFGYEDIGGKDVDAIFVKKSDIRSTAQNTALLKGITFASAKKIDGLSLEQVKCSNGCSWTCSNTCTGGCKGCSSSCSGGCNTACKGHCKGGCNSCTNTCTGGCKGCTGCSTGTKR